jgi:hypothetical protein
MLPLPMTVGIAIPLVLAFLFGGLVGGYCGWRRHAGRSAGDAGPGSHRTLKVVALTALLTLVFAAAGTYATLRIIFRAKPVQEASVDQAVADFRSAKPAAATAANKAAPAGGVYTYRSSGSSDLKVPLFGTEHRDLPESVPAVLLRDGDCWDLTVRFFEEHQWATRYCRGEDGAVHHPSSETVNVHFGQKVTASSACEPDEVIVAKMSPGASWSQRCTTKNDSGMGGPSSVDTEMTFVGIEEVEVGGEKVKALHIHRDVTMSGKQTGTTTRDYWFEESSALLVKFRHRMKSSGIGDIEQSYDLALTALTPSK